MAGWKDTLDRTASVAQRLGLDSRSINWNGSRLRAARRAAKLSQRELADMLRVKQPTIQRYERGNRTPSDSQAQQLAAAVGIDVEELFR